MRDESAFPIVVPGLVYNDGSIEQPCVESHGISIRDYFAAKAVSGLISCDAFHGSIYQQNPHQAALFAYEVADAMLEVRRPKVSNR